MNPQPTPFASRMKPQRGLIKGETVANAAKMIAEAAAAAIFIEVKGIHPPPLPFSFVVAASFHALSSYESRRRKKVCTDMERAKDKSWTVILCLNKYEYVV